MAKYKLSLKLSNNQTVEADGTIDIPSRIISESESVLFGPAAVSFAADTENSTGMYVSAENAISIAMTEGEKYRVVWDGVSYIVYDEVYSETTSTGGWYEWNILGNGDNALNGYNPETSSYPFAITRDRWKNSGEILIYATDRSTATSHTIAVYKISGEYDKIGPEYLYGYKKCLYPGKGKWSASNGPNTLTDTAEGSFAVGEANTISSIYSFVAGVTNTIAAKCSSVFGTANEVTGDGGSLLTGSGNKANADRVFVSGNGNEVSGSETVTGNNYTSGISGIIGNKNKMIGAAKYCFIAGSQNTMTGYNRFATILGAKNTITASESFGKAGTQYNFISGCSNTITDKHGVSIIGHYNVADFNFQTILGMYSAADNTAALKFGWGTASAKKNIFVVHKDGRVTAGADPTEDMDLATKKFVVPKPSGNPTEDSVVVVGSTGATSYKAVSELGGSGGGATTWYSHTVMITSGNTYTVLNFTLPFADEINTADKFISLINKLTKDGTKTFKANGTHVPNNNALNASKQYYTVYIIGGLTTMLNKTYLNGSCLQPTLVDDQVITMSSVMMANITEGIFADQVADLPTSI